MGLQPSAKAAEAEGYLLGSAARGCRQAMYVSGQMQGTAWGQQLMKLPREAGLIDFSVTAAHVRKLGFARGLC